MEKANDLGSAGKALGRVVQSIGLLGSAYDAISAIGEAYNTITDPNSTGGQKAGAVAKVLFKATLVAARVNPIINVVLTVADITGATDAAFKW